MSPLPSLPPTIQSALERVGSFANRPHTFGFITYNRPGKPRLMRSERRNSVQAVLLVLVRNVDIVSGRIIRPLGRLQECQIFADCSLQWLADAAGVSRRTLCRVLADLESVGWLKREAQAISTGPETGTLSIATVVRSLTERFFANLGLAKSFAKDRDYLFVHRSARAMKTLYKVVYAGAKAAFRAI